MREELVCDRKAARESSSVREREGGKGGMLLLHFLIELLSS